MLRFVWYHNKLLKDNLSILMQDANAYAKYSTIEYKADRESSPYHSCSCPIHLVHTTTVPPMLAWLFVLGRARAWRYLVSCASLPESPPSGCGRNATVNIRGVGLAGPASRPSIAAAGEEHENSRNEQADHRCKNCPHAHAIVCMASCAVAIDIILDDSKGREIARHDNQGDEPCESRQYRCKEGAAEARAEREKEGNESKTACDGM